MNASLVRTLFGLLWLLISGTAMSQDAVKLILVDGDMREDWPDHGCVAFHRENSSGPLTVNFTIGGTALRGTDYSAPAGNSIIIPDGDREVWLEFTPLPDLLTESAETITVTLQTGIGYTPTTITALKAAKLALGNASPKPCAKAAIRFLNQAAFGPDADSPADVDLIPQNAQVVMSMGFDNWITDQFARPVGLHQPYLDYVNKVTKGRVSWDSKPVSWWNRAMGVPALYPGGKTQLPDVLRQRIGFALSEIFVISDNLDELSGNPIGMSSYYDMLLKGAFGNFRDLLYNVATHPCMGVYLSHLQNSKGDPANGVFPDENFAREIMQLFTIGLWELNTDGSRRLDNSNQPIPTYDNATIMNMARVMTGFSWGGPKGTNFWSESNYIAPMRMWDEYHDVDPKTLLNGVTLPARVASDPDKGTAGLADFNAAIDCLFNHPNTPPFICKQLIQRLVTSNPSLGYVGRVATKFINNGNNVRGDMKAVIRAILMDEEARDPAALASATFGKMKEPYLRTVNLARSFNAKAGNGIYLLAYLYDVHFMEPQGAPSVFNFFKPGYAPAGEINDLGLVGPEFQIVNDVSSLSVPNYYYNVMRYGFNRWGSNNAKELVRPQTAAELALYNDVPALLRRLDMALTGGTLPNEQHQIVREAVEQINSSMWDWKNERIYLAIYLISSAPEFGIQR
jgi:uncharacterized protein (DUF1800 family)